MVFFFSKFSGAIMQLFFIFLLQSRSFFTCQSLYGLKTEDTSFYSIKNGPKIDAFLLGYCSRNYKNWKTKNISENNFYILHKQGC